MSPEKNAFAVFNAVENVTASVSSQPALTRAPNISLRFHLLVQYLKGHHLLYPFSFLVQHWKLVSISRNVSSSSNETKSSCLYSLSGLRS